MNAHDDKGIGAGSQRQAGFTMIELTIAAVVLAMMIYAVSTLTVSGGQAQEYSRRLSRVTEITQDLLGDIRLELATSARVFGNDAEGNANVAAFDLSTAPTPLPGVRLPTIAPTSTIGKDTVGAEITGNAMLFTKLAWSDRFVCTSGNDYIVDVYQWIAYYPTPEEGGPSPEHSIGLNLVRVESEPLVDAGGIDRITDATDLEEMLVHLGTGSPDATGESHPPAELVWVRGGLPTDVGTFRQIDEVNGTLSDTPFGGRADPWMVELASGEVRGLLSYRHHSVASNYSLSSFGVGKFGIIDNDDSGFPHGFEVQVVGPSSARQILVHLVCASTHRRGRPAWHDMMISVDTRDI